MAYTNNNTRNYNTSSQRRRPLTAQEKKRRAAARKRKKRIKRMITTVFVLLVVLVVFLVALVIKKFAGGGTKEYTVEAGQKELSEIVGSDDATLISGDYDLTVPGEYVVVINDGKEREITIKVVDTIDPVVMPKQGVVGVGKEIDPMSFVEKYEDATALKGEVLSKIDTSKSGVYDIELKFTDLGGNSTIVVTKVIVSDDTIPPEIACPDSKQINVGDSVLFSQLVSATDNEFATSEITLDYDTSELRVNEEGEYTVTITATDPAGNMAVREMKIVVIKPKYSQETVDELADAVLSEITKDNMSDKEKATAIYKWVQSNVGYISHSDKDDWLKAAYEGLHDHQGDCYVYAMVSKELLTRAGIKNMDIEKIPAESRHYWNLVDYGEGWYHFDTTPRKRRHNFCLVTTQELLEYSNANNKSHNYNADNYPEIN